MALVAMNVLLLYPNPFQCISSCFLTIDLPNIHPISQELGSVSEEVSELRKLLQNETQLRKAAEDELNKLKSQFEQFMQPGVRIKLYIAFPLLTFTKPSITNPHLTTKEE